MRRISFFVFFIWTVLYLFVWYIFDFFSIKNQIFYNLYGFEISLKIVLSFLLQFTVIWGYFYFFQKENLKYSAVRSLIFNFLIYFVYFMLILRVNTS